MHFDDYKYKLELHSHTLPVSPCSELPYEKFVENLAKEKYNGVALTNHFIKELQIFDTAKENCEYYLNDYYKVKELAKGKFEVYLGMEIRFTENLNDYLIYGITENEIEKAFNLLDKGIDNFYKEFKNDKNIIIQAHPFRKNLTLADPNSIDGIEVFNMHPNHNSSIPRAAKYALLHKEFVTTGGTDYHHTGHEGMFSMLSKYLPHNSLELAELIKSNDYIYSLSGNIIIPQNFKGKL